MMSKKKIITLLVGLVLLSTLSLSIHLVVNKAGNLYIVKTTPSLEDPVGLFASIELELNRPLKEMALKECVVQSEPAHPWELSQKNNVLVLTTFKNLIYGREYVVTINCPRLTQQLNLKVRSYENLTEEDFASVQIEKDISFAKEVSRVYEEQPWRANLPIITNSYEVNYSQTLNKYIVVFSLSPHSEKTPEDLAPEIFEKLNQIGAPDLEIIW